MSGDSMYGKCDVCGEDDHLMRTYFNYDIKCECHSPSHFEMVNHCSGCTPVPPVTTKITFKTESLKIVLDGRRPPAIIGIHGAPAPGNGYTCVVVNMENGEVVCACLAPNIPCGMYMLGFIDLEEAMSKHRQSIEPFNMEDLHKMRGMAVDMVTGRFPDGCKRIWHGSYFGGTPIPADVLEKLKQQYLV